MVPTTAFWVWVDVATTAWVFLLRHKSFSFLSLAMFFPAVAAVVAEALWGDLSSFLRVAVVGIPTAPRVSLPLALTLAIGVPYLFVHACKWFSIAIDWGNRQPRGGDGSSAVHASTTAGELVAGLLRAAGEELGWRCWLLPRLVKSRGRLGAYGTTGIAWGLFHVAIMVLMVKKVKNPHPVSTVVVQCLSCLTSSWMFGVVGELGGYSLWAPAVMHFVWNQLNPKVLGSVYTNKQGELQGLPVLVNGEGLAGCIVGSAGLVLVHFAAGF